MTSTLRATPRTTHGKNAARALRRSGRVPGVVYGHGGEGRAISIDALEAERLLASISVENTLIDLMVEGGAPTRALIREVQWHPVSPVLLHLDFLEVHAGEKVKLHVPIRLVGLAVGVDMHGGILDQSLYDLEIECLPNQIPEVAEVDVSALDVGGVLRVRDVALPNVKILNDPDVTVVSVVPPTVALPVETPVAEDGVGGNVQPELVRSRPVESDE
jgi:large subunit ribosomal protein L25